MGHTGNEVDQLFSILATELKANVKTIEDLQEIIENSDIKPKAIYRDLEYIFGWKNYVTPWLTDVPLVNHSKYNSFIVKKENGVVKFRAKRFPQFSDMEYEPRAGIRLLKENTQFYPVEAAEFRTDELPFEKIRRTVSIVTSKMPLLEKMKITESWDRLRKKLENVPLMRKNLRKMLLTDLPKQEGTVAPGIPEFLLDADDGNVISGDLHDESVHEGSFDDDDICVDMDICVYTDSKKGRPWVGRVKEMLPGGKFIIHWFERKSGRGNRYTAMFNQDGTPNILELELTMVMFTAFSEEKREDSFVIPPFWQKNIRLEYEKLDNKNN